MTSQTQTRSPRLSYLVRCWPVETEDGLVWRATAENPYNAESYSFANLGALFAFLESETEALVPTKKESS